MSSELHQKLADIQLIISDVDGVLTDGSLYIGQGDVELKKFCGKGELDYYQAPHGPDWTEFFLTGYAEELIKN